MRILVADDHSLFRDGLTSLLSAAGFDVVGEAGNGEQAIREAARLNPDVILIDLHMPVMTGLEALPQLRAQNPDSKVVLLTVSDKTEDLVTAVENGASGYLLKSIDSERFIEYLHRLEKGEVVISSELTLRLVTHLAQKPRHPVEASTVDPKSILSEREQELLRLVARGLPNKAIAAELRISENTVKYHLKHVLQKLNLSNRSEAAVYAVQNGIVPIKDE